MPVMNWHFSRSFHLIFLKTHNPYLSSSYRTKQPTLASNHSNCSLCSQIKQKHVYWMYDVPDTMFILQRVTCFKQDKTTKLYSIGVRPQARQQDQQPRPGSENLHGCSSKSLPEHPPPTYPSELEVQDDTKRDRWRKPTQCPEPQRS